MVLQYQMVFKNKRIPRTCKWRSKENNQATYKWFLSEWGNHVQKNPNLNLLRCVDFPKAERIMNKVHFRVCRPYMNNYVLEKNYSKLDITRWPGKRIVSTLSASAISFWYTTIWFTLHLLSFIPYLLLGRSFYVAWMLLDRLNRKL